MLAHACKLPTPLSRCLTPNNTVLPYPISARKSHLLCNDFPPYLFSPHLHFSAAMEAPFRIFQTLLLAGTLAVTTKATLSSKTDIGASDILPSEGVAIFFSALSVLYLCYQAISAFHKSGSCRAFTAISDLALSACWLGTFIPLAVQRGPMSCFDKQTSFTTSDGEVHHLRSYKMSSCHLSYAAIALSSLSFVSFCVSSFIVVRNSYDIKITPKRQGEILMEDDSTIYGDIPAKC